MLALRLQKKKKVKNINDDQGAIQGLIQRLTMRES
jgi:hypothetical protein